MTKRFLINHRKDIIIVILLILIVGWLQIFLLEPHLNYGFTPDDWWPLSRYKMGGLLSTWREQGIYSTYQALYMNTLHSFFGFNFQAYQATNHILKIISSMAVFPLILIIFKNRLLAFVTTILYAMAYSPVGTLELVARGSDFIAIIFMCIFLIVYYSHMNGFLKGIKGLILLLVLLLLSLFLSPIRMFPLLFLILIVDVYLSFINRSQKVWMDSLKRVLIIFSPYILVTVLSPSSILSFMGNAPAIISRIFLGNWQLLLYPLGSLGSIFLFTSNWPIFGAIRSENLQSYVSYVFNNVFIYFLVTSLLYAIILSIPLKKIWIFCLKILSLNFILQILVFTLFKHREFIPSDIRMGYDAVELYPVFLGIYILVLSYFTFREWVNRRRENNLLFALWLGPLFSFIFIFWIWIFKDWSVLFKGVHTYLNIPSVGSSLFIGSLIVIIYQKIKTSLGIIGKSIAVFVFLLLIPIFNINKEAIMNVWQLNNYSMDAKEHEKMRDRIWSGLGDFDTSKPALFYFDTSGDYINGRFYEQSVLGRFSDWMYFKGDYKPDSCAVPLFIINNTWQLKEIVIKINNKWVFNYHDFCYKSHTYDIEDFYAFRLNNKQPLDIKKDVLKEIGVGSE